MRGLLLLATLLMACGARPTALSPAPPQIPATAHMTTSEAQAAWALEPVPREIANKQFVRVHVGDSTYEGFLLDVRAESFEIARRGDRITFDARRWPSVADEGPQVVPSYEILSLPHEVAGRTEAAAEHNAASSPLVRLDLFELASAAHAAGFDREALLALEVLAKLCDGRLVSTLRSDLAARALHEAADSYVDTKTTRAEMRARLSAIAHRFLGTRAAEEAGAWVATLDRMIADDQRTAPATADPIDIRIADALRAMRDERCNPWSGWSEWPGDDAVGRLVQLGFSGVPTLLDYMEDDGLTRCLNFTRDAPEATDGRAVGSELRLASGAPLVQVLRVGDLVREALSRMARRNIKTRGEAHGWWQEVQARGEVEQYNGGGAYDLVLASRKSVQRDGKVGVARTLTLARRAAGRLRVDLVKLLADATGDAQLEFLRSEVLEGRILDARIAAARGLQRRR